MKEKGGSKLKDFRIFEPAEIPVKGNRVGPFNEFREFKKEEIQQSIVRRFETRVKMYPHKAAVKIDDGLLTYDALNGFANRVARQVLEKYDDTCRLSKQEKTRYLRQMMLHGWGIESQERLKRAVVFAAGAGGSGSPLLMQLALSGIGTIIVCDYDEVELSNLNRQVLHDDSRIGLNKALSAKMTLQRINPHVHVIAYPGKITRENLAQLAGEADIIFDNLDDMETKFLLSQYAVKKQIPHIISSMMDISSYAAIFHSPHTPCFYCLYDHDVLKEIEAFKTGMKDYRKKPNPVASPSMFLSTGFAVNEAIKILLGFENPAYNKYFFFNQKASAEIVNADGYRMISYPLNRHFRRLCQQQGFDWDKGWSGRFVEELDIIPDPDCPLCGKNKSIDLSWIDNPEKKERPVEIKTAPPVADETRPPKEETVPQAGSLPTAALLFGHNLEMIVGIMGVLKAGKVYVPLDATYPLERLEFMLEDSDCRVIVTDSNNMGLAVKLRDHVNKSIPIINVNDVAADENISKENLDISISPQDLAYILYTSGSTGIPKGVMQNHRNVLHFARVYTNALHINSEDRLTLFSSYSFDAAKMDIYGALLNGAALYPYDIKQAGSLDQLPRWLRNEKLTIFHSIPTVYRYFMDVLPSSGEDALPAVRLLVMGGEAVYKHDVDRYKQYFSDDCLFINGLGPTESTVTVQYFIDKHTEITRESVPVGFPTAETEVYLINEYGQEAQVFEIGEIVFKSDYLALGYLNHTKKTRQVFTRDPLTGSGRAYLTGDLGRRLPDGTIEFVGRKDFQVKIRGFRVEPGEIESRLDQVESIKKSAVVCQQLQDGENYLVAFYKTGQKQTVDELGLVRILKKSLPDYMIPNAFYRIDDFPLTPSGKIDRKVLSGYGIRELEKNVEYVAPETDKEKQIADLWLEVLKLDKIGIHDNFFERGGHSLKMIQLNSKLKKVFKRDIPMVAMLRYPTIYLLARYLQEGEFDTIVQKPLEKEREKSRLGKLRTRRKVDLNVDRN